MEQKILRLLKYVQQNIPFYKQININKFEEIPIITKENIKHNYSDFLSEKIERRNLVLEELQKDFEINDYVIEKKITNSIVLEWTSGSSGIPFKCIKSFGERKQIALDMWKSRMRIDKALLPNQIFSMIHTGLEKGSYDIRDYSEENIRNLYTNIKNNGYSCIHTTANLLNRHITRSGIEKEFFYGIVPYIEVTGSYLSLKEKLMIEKILGAKVIDLYGMIETWGIALSDKNGIFKLINGNIKMEILDENNKRILEKGKEGKIVITALNQYLMPFIRYDTGDFGKIIDTEQGIGLKINREREANYISLNGDFINGNQFVKQVLRKIYWIQDFQEIYNICLLQQNDKLIFILNEISMKQKFEDIAKDILRKTFKYTSKIEFRYVDEKQFDSLNPKAYLFIKK